MAGLKLFWESVQNASTYNVYWRTTPGVTIQNGNPITHINDIFFHHRNLTIGTTYYYIVLGVDSAGNLGPPSIEFSGTPIQILVAPTLLTATAGIKHIAYTWTSVTGAATYTLYYDTTTPVDINTAPHVSGIVSTSVDVTGLLDNTTYYAVVTAVNGADHSGKSNELSATTSAPPVLSVSIV